MKNYIIRNINSIDFNDEDNMRYLLDKVDLQNNLKDLNWEISDMNIFHLDKEPRGICKVSL
jgi:hypothetical protein